MLTGLRTWRMGVKSLLLHPLRSLLTVLGIFIGVASVIWLLAIGEGISTKAREQIESLGADNIIVRSIKTMENTQGSGFSVANYGLTRKDYYRLVATIPTVRRAVPIRELRRLFSYGDSKPIEGRLVALEPSSLRIRFDGDVVSIPADQVRSVAHLRSRAGLWRRPWRGDRCGLGPLSALSSQLSALS